MAGLSWVDWSTFREGLSSKELPRISDLSVSRASDSLERKATGKLPDTKRLAMMGSDWCSLMA